MSTIEHPCDGGCGKTIDAMNESLTLESTELLDEIVDPFTGEAWALCYCQDCAHRLYPQEYAPDYIDKDGYRYYGWKPGDPPF
jgi:hypothetical protein